MARWTRWLGGCGCGTGVLVVGLALGGWFWLQSGDGEDFLAKQVEKQLRASLDEGGFTVGDLRLKGKNLALDDLVLEGADGKGRIQIGSVRTKIRMRSLLKRTILLQDLVIADIDVVLPRREDGALDLPTFTSSGSTGPTTYMPLGFKLVAQNARVERVDVALPDDSVDVDGLTGALNVVADQDRVIVDGVSLQAELVEPALHTTGLDGSLVLHNDDLARFDLALGTQQTELTFGGAVPGLMGDALAFDLTVNGQVDRPTLKTALTWSGNGDATASIRDEGGPLGVDAALDGDLESLTLARLGLDLWDERVLEATGTVCLAEACGGNQADLELVSNAPTPLFTELQLEGRAGRVAFPVTVTFPAEGPVGLDGTVQAEGLSLAGTVAVPRAELAIGGTVAPAVALDVNGTIPTVRVQGGQPVVASAALDLRVTDKDVGGSATLRPHGDIDAVVRSDFGFDFQTMAVRLTGTEATVEDTKLVADGPITARIVEGGVADVHAAVTLDEGRLQADLERATATTQRGKIEVTELSLGSLGKLAAAFAPDLPAIGGMVDGTVDLNGARAIQASIEAKELRVEGVLEPTWVKLDGGMQGDALVAKIEAIESDEGPLLTADLRAAVAPGAFAPTCTDEVHGAIELKESALTALDDHLPALENAPLDGSLSGTLAVDGPLCDPTLDLDGRLEGMYVDKPLSIAAKVTDGTEHASVVVASVDVGDQRVGDLDMRVEHPRPDEWLQAADPVAELGAWTAEARVGDLPVAWFTNGLGGTVVADLDASGEGLEPASVEGRVAIEEPTVEQQPLEAVGLTLATVDGRLELDAKVAANGDTSLVAHGQAALDDLLKKGMETPFTAEVEPSKVPLALAAGFLPMYFREAAGTLELEARAEGTFADPKLDGAMALDGGQIVVVPTGIRYSAIDLTARFEDDVLRIEKAQMNSRPRYGRFARRESTQSLQVTGTVGFHDASIEPDLDVKLDEFWAVATNQAVVEMSGELQVGGSLTAPDLKGDVRMDQARFDLDRYLFIPAAGEHLHPEIVFVDGRPSNLVAPPEQPSLLDSADVDVSVDTGRSARLEATVPLAADAGLVGSVSDVEVDTQLEGQVDVAVDDGQPSVEGRIEAEGEATLLSARFDVEQGTVAFEGQSYMSPRVDFTLRRANDDFGAVTARVRGTPESLTVDELTSDAGLSEADVMAQLLFGRPLSSLDSNQAGAGASVVQQTLLSVAGGPLEQAIGIELVDSIDVSSDSVSVGWAIADAGFLTLKLDPTAQPNENTTAVEVSIFLGAVAEAEITTGDKADSSAWLLLEETF